MGLVRGIRLRLREAAVELRTDPSGGLGNGLNQVFLVLFKEGIAVDLFPAGHAGPTAAQAEIVVPITGI